MADISHFIYEDQVRKPNPIKKHYALDRTVDKVRTLSSNITKLEEARIFKKNKQLMEELGIVYDSSLLPKVIMIELGEFDKEDAGISEMVQRQLDTAHCGKIIHPDTFMPALSQCIYAVKSPTTGAFRMIDGQHTATNLAAMLHNGMMSHDGPWQTLQHPCLYVETDDLSFALKAFSLINGKGKKGLSPYKKLENQVQIVRVCSNTDDAEDVLVEQKISVAQNNNCYAVEQKSDLSKKPGTFTHIAKFLTLNVEQIERATAWQDKYFHYIPVNGALWFLFADLTSGFKTAKIKLTDELLGEIAGMYQNLFSDYAEYHAEIQTAWGKFTKTKYGTKYPWNDDAIAIATVQLYKKLGGTAEVPGYMLDQFNEYKTGSSLIDFFPEYITDLFDE